MTLMTLGITLKQKLQQEGLMVLKTVLERQVAPSGRQNSMRV